MMLILGGHDLLCAVVGRKLNARALIQPTKSDSVASSR